MNTPNHKGSIRLQRINASILHETCLYIMTQLDDQKLKHAQLSSAEVSKDLSHAKIYFTVADSTIDIKKLQQALDKIGPMLQHHLAQTLNLRMTPHIRFYYDQQAAEADRLLDILSKL